MKDLLLKVALPLLACALVLSALKFGFDWWAHRKLEQQGAAVVARREAATTANAKAQRKADSLIFFTQGRQHEVQRQLDANSHHAESLPPVVLPARPPREQ